MASESQDEFRLLVNRARLAPGDLGPVWKIVEDLGGQIADVRHQVREQRTVTDGQAWQLQQIQKNQDAVRSILARIAWGFAGGTSTIVVLEIVQLLHSLGPK